MGLGPLMFPMLWRKRISFVGFEAVKGSAWSCPRGLSISETWGGAKGEGQGRAR